jgi:hypothetical protein
MGRRSHLAVVVAVAVVAAVVDGGGHDPIRHAPVHSLGNPVLVTT